MDALSCWPDVPTWHSLIPLYSLNAFHAPTAAANSKHMNEPSAFCQSSILHFGILSILLILSPFPAGFAIEVLDMINRIYRIKTFGNSVGRNSMESQALLTNCLGLPVPRTLTVNRLRMGMFFIPSACHDANQVD